MHQAERAFRKKIGTCFAAQPPEKRPVSVYLLDVVEIEGFSQAVMMNFSSVREDEAGEEPPDLTDQEAEGVHQLTSVGNSEMRSGSVFFSGLPLRESNARHWSISMPQDPERFMLID